MRSTPSTDGLIASMCTILSFEYVVHSYGKHLQLALPVNTDSLPAIVSSHCNHTFCILVSRHTLQVDSAFIDLLALPEAGTVEVKQLVGNILLKHVAFRRYTGSVRFLEWDTVVKGVHSVMHN